jgi:hypothetical protein
MTKNLLRYAWFLILLVFVTLGCRLVSRIGETRATVEAAATNAKQGLKVLGTAQAMLTQVDSSDILGTARAVETEIGASGLLETAVAAATQEGPSMLETAQAFATQEGPGLQETAKAAMGEPPADIPIIEGEKDNIVTGEFLVSYEIPMSLQDVAEFYKAEMPANGWSKVEQGWIESETIAALNYEKSDRTAAITLNINPVNRKTLVVILIAEK